jgi:hypothetical protein
MRQCRTGADAWSVRFMLFALLGRRPGRKSKPTSGSWLPVTLLIPSTWCSSSTVRGTAHSRSRHQHGRNHTNLNVLSISRPLGVEGPMSSEPCCGGWCVVKWDSGTAGREVIRQENHLPGVPLSVQSVITRVPGVAAGPFAPGHLGELTQIVPFEMVDAALEAARAVQSRVRALPSRVVVYPEWRW